MGKSDIEENTLKTGETTKKSDKKRVDRFAGICTAFKRLQILYGGKNRCLTVVRPLASVSFFP
jgi:hypothetical protein